LAQQKNQQALPSPDSPVLLPNQDNLDGLLGRKLLELADVDQIIV
jgi:hypothetical protein